MSSTTLVAGTSGLTRRGRTIALWVILLAFFMDLLDTTIVNVAIPNIQEHLEASYSAIQWIVAGYQLAFALFLITGGRLGDIFGYKTMFMIGMAGFTLASALAGLADSATFLIAARLFQGFTAAIMVPQILSTIQVMFTDPKERQGVSAFYGALGGLASVAGPILGALMITGNVLGLGWRAIFMVNIPVGIVALILAWMYVPNAKSPHPARVDFVGVVMVVLAMLLIMYPLIQGRDLGWPVWTFAAMAAAVVVFVLFWFYQKARERSGNSPLVVPSLFRHRSFTAGVLVSGSFFAVMAGFFLTMTLFFQIGLGWSVLKAGLTGIPFSIGVGAAAGVSGPVLVPKFGRAVITTGALTMAAGLGLFALTVTWFGAALTPGELIPALLLGGIGMGCIVASVFPFVLSDVPLKDAGSASGIINAIGQVGGAIGVALVGVVFFGFLGSRAMESVETVRPDLTAALTESGVPAFVQPGIIEGFETCFNDRANQKDFSQVPESCTKAEQAGAAFAAMNPGGADAALGERITATAMEANRINFTTSFVLTLMFQIGGLIVVALLTFLLPARPRQSSPELAMAV